MREYTILGLEFHRYQVSILKACEDLHMLCTGAAEYVEPIRPWFLYSYLKQTLGLWRPATHCSAYDLIVKSLVDRVVYDFENCSWAPSEKEAIDYFNKYYTESLQLIRSLLPCYYPSDDCPGRSCEFCSNSTCCPVNQL